jgi:hypothetical protein
MFENDAQLDEVNRRIQGIRWFNKIHKDSVTVGDVNITLHRTCRVPGSKLNELPASLGHFPIYKVADFKHGVPNGWREDSFFMPMYRQEAMWMSFSSLTPKALVVGAGNINAISGKPFSNLGGMDVRLEEKQNYVVVPTQPWLDGFKAEDGKVYQFVAAEMGSGETVEGQITGEETIGGTQFIVYDASKSLPSLPSPYAYCEEMVYSLCATKSFSSVRALRSSTVSMGLGRGGEINQKIYPDPYGVDVWKKEPSAVERLYFISSDDFKQVTGYNAPSTPVTFEEYKKQGLPWFSMYDKHLGDTPGSNVFGKLKPVGEKNLLDKLK